MEATRANPYVGPRTFEEKDSDYFFGRTQEAQALRSLILGHRFVLFYATSGAGKSSLINAQVIPELRREKFVPLRARVSSGQKPEALAATDNPYIFNLLANLSPDAAADELQQLTLTEYLETHHQITAAEEESFLEPARILIIDQFEELVTTNQMYWEKRADFFRQLSKAMKRDSLLWVLLVMREDYVIELESYAHLVPGKLRVRYHMERMREPAALKAIEAPALKAGRPFEEGSPDQPAVAERLLNDLRQIRVAGSEQTVTGEFVEPVQLQLVCYSLWEELRSRPGDVISAADTAAAANVDNTLGDYYDNAIRQVVEQTAVDEQATRNWFGENLITETDTRGLVFRGDTHSEGMDNTVIDILISRFFLLRSSSIGGGTWYELVHDRFIPAIRQANEKAWTQLERQRRHDALEAQKSSFEADKRKLRRSYLRIIGIAAIILTIFGILFVALLQKNRELEAAVLRARTAANREAAGVGVAERNYFAVQTADAVAAEYATQSALLVEERNLLLEQQRQSLIEQSTRAAGSLANLEPAEVTAQSATANALAQQILVVEATQTAVSLIREQEALSAQQTATAAPPYRVIGKSFSGKPIIVRRFGSGEKVVVLVGGIHAGRSPGSVELAEIAASWFTENIDAIPVSLTVYVVPNFSPDIYAPDQPEGRFNANGVDLNRNWECDWNPNPIVTLGTRQPGAGGEAPLSEPETQALSEFLEEVAPDAVVFWDAEYTGGLVVPGGCPEISEEAASLAKAYSEMTGYNYNRDFVRNIEGDATKSLGSRGVPAFFVFLPDVWSPHWETNWKAVMNLFEMVAAQ